MNDSTTFRQINEIEWKMIKNTLSTISTKTVSVLAEIERELFIKFSSSNSKNVYPSIYLVQKKLIAIIREIHSETNIISSGLYFGMLKRGEFYLSLEGAEFLHVYDCFSDKNILHVNNEGEKSILYGNQIIRKNVLKISPDLNKNQLLLILNSSQELIALAKSKVNYSESKKLEPNEIFALNLIDKGYYLREKQ